MNQLLPKDDNAKMIVEMDFTGGTPMKVCEFEDTDNAFDVPQKKKEKRGVCGFLKKYFWEGQSLEEERLMETTDCNKDGSREVSWDERYRKYIGFLIPFVFMHTVWWTLAVKYNVFRLYPYRYQMPITMIFGATVAGMTSEGGGAIAFPVMTLYLGIDSVTARDFSLMIQSCGMTAAAFTIIWMKIQLEWHSIICCSIAATVGIIVGFEFVDPLLTGEEKKMLFVSIWVSFAIALFILNRNKKRRTFSNIEMFDWKKAVVLFLVGFVGGLCSSFAGSGVDICSFSVLTLYFRVSEKVATPTSVVLMAMNTCVGFFWRQLIMQDINSLAWEYFQCSVPVVVLFAPLGSFLSSHFHRLVLAALIYVLEVAALVGFLCTGPELRLILIGCGIIVFSFVFFTLMGRQGEKFSKTVEKHLAKAYMLNHADHTDSGELSSKLLTLANTNSA